MARCSRCGHRFEVAEAAPAAIDRADDCKNGVAAPKTEQPPRDNVPIAPRKAVSSVYSSRTKRFLLPNHSEWRTIAIGALVFIGVPTIAILLILVIGALTRH